MGVFGNHRHIAFTACALLSACGSDSRTERPSSARGIWTAREAAVVSTGFVPALAELLARPDDEALQNLLSPASGWVVQDASWTSVPKEDFDHEGTPSFDLGCGTIVEGRRIDSDSDGVPEKLLAEYACEDEYGYRYEGRAYAFDLDDENVFGGYGFLLRNYGVKKENSGFVIDGSAELKPRATGGGFDFAGSFTLASFSPATEKRWGLFVDSGWQPDQATWPERAGAVDRLKGFLSLRMNAEELVVEVSGRDLRYDSACAERPVSGELHLKGASGDELVQSYESCRIVSTAFAGTPL